MSTRAGIERELRIALVAMIEGDTVSADVASISDDVVTLDTGGGANFAPRDIVVMTGANAGHVASVVLVDGDDVTLSVEPPEGTPDGDTIDAGVVAFLRAATGDEQTVYLEPLIGPDPVERLKAPEAGPRCVAKLKIWPDVMTSTHRSRAEVEIEVSGRDVEYVEAATRALVVLFHGSADDIAEEIGDPSDVWEVSAPQVVEVDNAMGIITRAVQFDVISAAAEVAV